MRTALLILVGAAVAGCVGDAVVVAPVADASTSDTTTIVDSAAADGTAVDASTLDVTPPGDAAPDSGPKTNFSCGTPAVCDFGAQACCYTSGDSTGSCANHKPDGGAPCGSGQQYRLECSATSQCGAGEVCCALKLRFAAGDAGPSPFTASCSQTCSNTQLFFIKVLCNTTSDCVSGTCQPISAGFPKGFKECM